MRILIVAPKVTELKVIPLPLGLAYISAQMKRDGHEVFWLNMNHHDEDMESLIRQAMCLHDPEVVATGGMYLYMEFTRAVFVMAKRVNPRIICLTGGTGLTAEPELFINHTGANIGVIGEGEATVSELLRVLSSGMTDEIAGVCGIIHRAPSGELVRTPPRQLDRNIDGYPWPDLDGFDYAQTMRELQNISDFSVFAGSVLERPRMIPLITSRACPYSCTFCFHTGGRKYTERSLDDVFAELDYHVNKFKANFIVILDEVFCPNKTRMREFCARIKPYGVKWWSQSHVKMFDAERVAMMRDAGLVGSSYGIESMSNQVLKSMKKHNTTEAVARTLQQTYESGLDIQGNLIFGDQAETLETAEESLTWWEKNLHLGINLTMIALYPRSEMYVRAVEKKLIKNPQGFITGGCPIINASDMSDVEFAQLRVRVEISNLLRYYCQITEYAAERKRSCVHGKLYRLTAVCPHCGASSEYRNVALPINSNTTFFLACRTCYRRFAPPLFKRAAKEIQLDKSAMKAAGLADRGELDEAEALCRENLSLSAFHAGSLYVISKIMRQRGHHDRAFLAARMAATYNPAHPEYLELLADTAPDGFVGRAGPAFRKHAAWLREKDIRGVTYVSP